MAWLASPCLPRHDGLCRDGGHQTSGKPSDTKKTPIRKNRARIRWSIQEIRRIAHRLKQHRIEPAFVIAWSLRRRAHQAAARRAHLKRKSQL
jgi:hypothetical protein